MLQTQSKPVIDYFAGSANITKALPSGATGFKIANDGDSTLTFTINGLTITVKAGETVSDDFREFFTVTVTSTVAFRAWVRG
jgi:hypothetical protein